MPDASVDFTFYNIDLQPLWSTSKVFYASWTRTVNSLGSAAVELPAKNHNFSTLLESRIMVISTSGEPAPNLETAWFLTALREVPSHDGRSSHYLLEFEDSLTLLDNRIIPIRADFPQGSEPRSRINTIATRALEQVYDVTLGLLAGPNRILEPTITQKAAITAVAPVIEKEIPWKRGLTTLKQIAQTSRDQGSPIYFDLLARTASGTLSFLFQTYAGQRGADQSLQIVTSDDPLFILADFTYNFKVTNVSYVGGSGRGQNRLVAEVVYPGTSSIERVEVFRSAQSSNQQLLEDEASHLVDATAGKISLAGRLLGRLGDQYNFGDLLTLQHRDLRVPSEISSIRYILDQQHLTREVIARSVE